MSSILKRVIGLTGGVGTGKTTVSRYLAQTYHVPILDADLYAREAVAAGSPILTEIAQRYGQEILLADGTLNRQRLGEIIFNDRAEKTWLEGKIHPFVRAKFAAKIKQLEADTIVLVIPLLLEANMADLVTEIWVVSCSEREQIRRLMERDRLSETQAIARINSQLPLEAKVAVADVVLDNSADLNALFEQISTSWPKRNENAKIIAPKHLL